MEIYRPIKDQTAGQRGHATFVPVRSRMIRYLVLFILVICVSFTKVQAETVKITTGEWQPFISQAYKHDGVVLHIIREAFARKNLEVEIAFLPWARAVKYVEDGTWDAMAITSSRFSETGKTHLYSDPVYVGEDVLFHRKDTPLDWQTFSDLFGQNFGAVLSYNYTDAYRAALKEKQITQVIAARPELLFPMLAAKRFDLFIMEQKAGMFIYNTLYREKLGDVITYNQKPLSALDYSVRFSGDGEKSQRLHKLFNQSLKEMVEDGTIDRFYQDFEAGFYLKP